MDEKSGTIKLLLIEDNPPAAQLVGKMLAEANDPRFDLRIAEQLDAGLESLAQGDIDVALLDLSLEGGRGLETLARMKAQAPHLPILVLTGLDQEALAMNMVQAGARDYLVKEQLQSQALTRTILQAVEHGRLRQSEEQLRHIIEKNADSIVIVDQSGIVRFVNPAAQVLFGREAEAWIGAPFDFPVQAGETEDVAIVGPGGETVMAEMRVVNIEWEGETASLASLRDISRRQQMLAELERTGLEQIHLKDQFLSRVSHELRSPLAAVYEFVTILLDGLAGELSPEQREYLEIMLRNVHQLQTMIGDLLTLARSEAGTLTVQPQPTSVAEVIAETLGTMGAAAGAKGITLLADFSNDLPPSYADPDRLHEILVNLIENALKFAPENEPITVRAQVSEADPEFLCISVADTGCGINPQEAKKIFDYMYQVESGSESCRKGLGLGLYICRELVTRHGGQIWVQSQPGQGSVFYFTLPIFSLERVLLPLIAENQAMTDSVALITVEVCPAQNSPAAQIEETHFQQVYHLLQRCILSVRDVLLPRMVHLGKDEVFFIVAFADPSGAKAIVRRIEEQLEALKAIQNIALEAEGSFTMVEIPPVKENLPPEQLARAVTHGIKDRMNQVFNHRWKLYEQEKTAYCG